MLQPRKKFISLCSRLQIASNVKHEPFDGVQIDSSCHLILAGKFIESFRWEFLSVARTRPGCIRGNVHYLRENETENETTETTPIAVASLTVSVG